MVVMTFKRKTTALSENVARGNPSEIQSLVQLCEKSPLADFIIKKNQET